MLWRIVLQEIPEYSRQIGQLVRVITSHVLVATSIYISVGTAKLSSKCKCAQRSLCYHVTTRYMGKQSETFNPELVLTLNMCHKVSLVNVRITTKLKSVSICALDNSKFHSSVHGFGQSPNRSETSEFKTDQPDDVLNV